MQREYTTPAGQVYTLYKDMLTQPHLLIAGATGSGKSTVVNGIINTALYHSPAMVQFILIDPKGTELSEYEDLPHILRYSQATGDCIAALQYAMDLTRQRFNAMKKARARMFDGADVYIVIDELMYLLNQPATKRRTIQLLQDIMVIARAARVHVIACTQFIPAIPTCIRCNFDCKLALRTATAQDSRNILGIKGCECFPVPSTEHRAFGALMIDGVVQVYNLPQDNAPDRARLIDYWTPRKKPLFKLFNR